ncbi:MAG: immunoglobulin domain-containing protein [Limisphaerales bacterium]
MLRSRLITTSTSASWTTCAWKFPAVAPTITTNPQPQIVKLGANVTFTVSATGLPAPDFQWRFNGTNIFGATNASYSFANVQPADTGNYSVVVANVAGSVTSADAALALLPPPAAQFQSISRQPDGSLQISFNGDTGWTYTVEVSTNLVHWSVLTNLTSDSGIFNLTIGSTTNSPQQFYRTRVGP